MSIKDLITETHKVTLVNEVVNSITIHIPELAGRMVQAGFDPSNIEDGWTDTIMDSLEELYQLETRLGEYFHAKTGGAPCKSGGSGNVPCVRLPADESIKKDKKKWSVSTYKPGTEKHLGLLEFQSDDGEYHTFYVIELPDRLVFGGAVNAGFSESGYILKNGLSTDEALQELMTDLETYYRDGGEYTSHIVYNERM